MSEKHDKCGTPECCGNCETTNISEQSVKIPAKLHMMSKTAQKAWAARNNVNLSDVLKGSSVAQVKKATPPPKTLPSMRSKEQQPTSADPAERIKAIKDAAEKARLRKQVAAHRQFWGGELGGGYSMPGSGFRRYSEEVEQIDLEESQDTHSLVHKSGKILKKGDKVKDFRGETHTIKDFSAPLHSASTGRVTTNQGSFYPGVIDAKIVAKKSVKEERTEVKDKDGNVTSWKDDSEWKKSTVKKDSRGKVTNLSDKARRETEKLSTKAGKRLFGINRAAKRLAKEEVEQVDELSRKTLSSYVSKASNAAAQHGVEYGQKKAEADEMDRVMNRHMDHSDKDKIRNIMKTSIKDVEKPRAKAGKRLFGINRAAKRLAKEEVEDIMHEEEKQALKKKYMEKMKGKTATGKKPNPINMDPKITIRV